MITISSIGVVRLLEGYTNMGNLYSADISSMTEDKWGPLPDNNVPTVECPAECYMPRKHYFRN